MKPVARQMELERMRTAVERTYNCAALHLYTWPVQETVGEKSWRGEVEIFALRAKPESAICYAWMPDAGFTDRIFTVLAAPPVRSPGEAVRTRLRGEATEQA